MTAPRVPGLPNLVVAGVTKAGTTSLYRYLGQHPDVGVADVKEVDHYAPMVHGEPPPPLADYAAHFADCVDAPWRLEASPRYFIGGPSLVRQLLADLGTPKVMVTLRDPVARVWSSYTYKRSKNRLPDGMRFAGFVDECQRVVEDGSVRDPARSAYRTLATGLYADHLGDWFDGVREHDFRVVFFDDLAARAQATTVGLCEWIGLDPAPVADFDFGVRNATYQPRSHALKAAAQRVNARLSKVARDDSAFTRALRSSYQRMNSGSLDERFPPGERARLEQFYRPSLVALGELLRDHGYDLPPWLHQQP